MWSVQNYLAHFAVVVNWVVLGVIIRDVAASGSPENMELLLVDAILHPVKSHVHRFGSDLFDGAVRDAACRGVVDLNRGGRLRVSHFDERDADGHGLLAVKE